MADIFLAPGEVSCIYTVGKAYHKTSYHEVPLLLLLIAVFERQDKIWKQEPSGKCEIGHQACVEGARPGRVGHRR